MLCRAQHPSAVVTLIYIETSKAVLTAYADGTIQILDEMDIETCKVKSHFDDLYFHAGDLHCVVYLDSGSIIASGGNEPSDGVRIWDSERGKCEGEALSTPDYEILSMAFLDDFPLLVVCSSDSKFRIWGMKHSNFKNDCVAVRTNEVPEGGRVLPELSADQLGLDEESSPKILLPEIDRAMGGLPPGSPKRKVVAGDGRKIDQGKSPVSVVVWDAEEECIYTGDEAGHLRKWNLRR